MVKGGMVDVKGGGWHGEGCNGEGWEGTAVKVQMAKWNGALVEW